MGYSVMRTQESWYWRRPPKSAQLFSVEILSVLVRKILQERTGKKWYINLWKASDEDEVEDGLMAGKVTGYALKSFLNFFFRSTIFSSVMEDSRWQAST